MSENFRSKIKSILLIFLGLFLYPLNGLCQKSVEWYLVWGENEVPYGLWTGEWNLDTPVRVKVVLNEFEVGEEVPYSWYRDITSDPTFPDREAIGSATYTVQGPDPQEQFYIEIPLPDPTPAGWGLPNEFDTYTVTLRAEIPGYKDEVEWFHWWNYVAPEQVGTCLGMVKNDVPAPENWSFEWGDETGGLGNPQYSAETGWFDEIHVYVEDLSAPVFWQWSIDVQNDNVLGTISQSGAVEPTGGPQDFTIPVYFPDPSCLWGAPNSEGKYVAEVNLWTSICGSQTWTYTWDPECIACSGDLNTPPSQIGYKSTSDIPPLDFPGYYWPDEGFEGMPEYMVPLPSYFKSVLITNGVERAFPGWCVDLFTLLEYDQLYTDGDVTLHRTLNLDEDGDGFADVNELTGTTSNVAVNINGDIIGAPENLARVNYIVNQYYRGVYEPYGVTYAEVQAAIWALLSIGQSDDEGYSHIEIDPDTGIGSGGLIQWDDDLKEMLIADAMADGIEQYSPTNCELMGVLAQTGEGRQTVMMMVPYCLYKCMENYALVTGGISNFEDGLNNSGEGLRFPCVTNIVAAGTGMHQLADGNPGVININVPGEVKRALLYWDGESAYGTPHGVIDSITVNGVNKYGILIGGPTKFFSAGGKGDIMFQSYRADITELVTTGDNTLFIEGTDFNYPVNLAADGAGLLVIYEDEANGAEVLIQDGLDLAYHGFSEPLKSTIPQDYFFAPADYDRIANLILLVGSVSCEDALRPNQVVITVGGEMTVLDNPLGGHDGCEWDTEQIDVLIPAGADSLTVEVVSTDVSNPSGASLAWICAALSVPDVCSQGNPQAAASGSVIVDGTTDDWDLDADFFANMYRAAKSSKPIESFLYLKYDDENETLYSLVLSKDGVPVLDMPDDAYIKIDDVKQVDGTFDNDGTPPDFAWVYDGEGTLIGWEASTPQGNGEYNLNVHTQVFDDGEAQTSAVADRDIPLTIFDSIIKPIFLVIDEDSIDDASEPNLFSSLDVNGNKADIGYRNQLNYFANHIGEQIVLYTGTVGDEGWFALPSIPTDWIYAGPTNDGVANFVAAGPGLGSGADPESLLLSIPDVTPLRATGLDMLEGKTVFAIVYDGDVAVGYDPLQGNLQGNNLGVVAFKVISVESNTDYSPDSLPKVTVEILDADTLRSIPKVLMSDAPVPVSASEPYDVDPPSPFDENLKAYWTFDEGSGIIANDSTENNHNGVLLQGPVWDTGYVNTAISFDGINDYVDVGSFDVEGTGLTLCAWIRADQFDHLGDNDARIISKAIGTAEADHYWMLSTIESGGQTRLRFRLKTFNGTTSTLIATSGDLQANVWTHVAAVFDGNDMILYKDGVEVGRMDKNGTVAVNDLIPVWIGSNPPTSTSRPFKGNIDEVRIYDRALSQADIQNIIDGEDIPPVPTPTITPTPTDTLIPTITPTPTVTPTPLALIDLAGYWNFNEGSGGTVADQSGNGNTGVLQSGAGWGTGYSGTGGSFDGYNDYVDAGSFDLSGNAMTIAAWINADRFDNLSGHDARILSKAVGTAEADHYWMLSTIESSGNTRLRFRLKTNGSTKTLIASSGNLSAGVWTHVAAVYDGSNMMLYKDGVQVGSTSKSGTMNTNPAVSVWIGNNPPSDSSRPFDGIIDEVYVFNRALNAIDIQNLMNPPAASVSGGYHSDFFSERLPTPMPLKYFGSPTPTPTPTPFVPDQKAVRLNPAYSSRR